MNLRNTFPPVAAFLLLVVANAHAEDGWKPLCNGTDLTGWTSEPKLDHWSVRDGVIIGKNGAEKKGSMLWTDAKFGDFVVETDFRFEGIVDSGVFIKGMDYHVNLGISSSLMTDMTCSIYAPKDGEKYPGKARDVAVAMKPGDWNHLRIEAMGKRITVHLNGREVLVYETKALETTGSIGLQVHAGHDMKIEFRNPRVKPLP
ncbi:MAG: DUF1080 domain-containing protein [Luteolibacter sp.]|jgi:hypothetical protein|nr:DUF1080 domain-containing protein [Luteolibacter sp.]